MDTRILVVIWGGDQGILDLYTLKREGQDSGNSIEKEVSGEMPMNLRLEALQNCASAAEKWTFRKMGDTDG